MRRLLVLAALLALAPACGSSESETAPTATATTSDSELAGESLDGETVSLADFRGKRVLLNVWSSW
jgi:hypothetical protein